MIPQSIRNKLSASVSLSELGSLGSSASFTDRHVTRSLRRFACYTSWNAHRSLRSNLVKCYVDTGIRVRQARIEDAKAVASVCAEVKDVPLPVVMSCFCLCS